MTALVQWGIFRYGMGVAALVVLQHLNLIWGQSINPSDAHFMFPSDSQIQNLTCPTVSCPTCSSPTCIPSVVAQQSSVIVSAHTLIATGGIHVQGNITQGNSILNISAITSENHDLHVRLDTLQTQLNASMALSSHLQAQLNATMSHSVQLESRLNNSLAHSELLQSQLNTSLNSSEVLQRQLSNLLPQLNGYAGRLLTLSTSVSNVRSEFESFAADPSVSRIRVGNQILNLLSISLPYQQIHSTYDTRCTQNASNPMFPYGSLVGASGCGYSSDPYLHLKTNYVCGAPTVHVMYHFNFRGYIFRNAESFNCRCFGYLYGSRGLTFNTTNCDDTYPSRSGTNVNMTTYCSPESNNLVMRFHDPGYQYNQWHASDLVADFDAGGSGYSSRMSDFIDFIDIAHHSDPMIW
eukprot:m.163661 g.163661  ORF g.163661 m.163661 type:complete len:408 (+) comp18108_c0_seq1:198-1421(+)